MALAYLPKGKLDSLPLVMGLLGAILLLQTLANPLYLSLNVLLNARAPTRSHLSSINAWCELVQQVAIGCGAELGSVGFAWGVEHDLLDGKLVWYILLLLSSFTAIMSQRLTHRDGWRELSGQL